MLAADPAGLPHTIEQGLRSLFSVPQTALRLWAIDEQFKHLDCALPAEPEVITLANSMKTPYCGPNTEFVAASWLPDQGRSARSVALIPLRVGVQPEAFGLLVLGSADPSRFSADMGTAFLERIGELCSATAARLMPGTTTQQHSVQ